MPKYKRRQIDVEARRIEDSGEARRADGRTEIARPGEWIVTEPSGEQLVVSDEAFRRGYEAVDAEAVAALARPLNTVRTAKGASVPATPPPINATSPEATPAPSSTADLTSPT